MISQLFALPLRALIVVTALPTPPALGAALAGPSTTFGAAMSSPPAERDPFNLPACRSRGRRSHPTARLLRSTR